MILICGRKDTGSFTLRDTDIFYIYKIVKKRVYVVGIYHDMQDYENTVR